MFLHLLICPSALQSVFFIIYVSLYQSDDNLCISNCLYLLTYSSLYLSSCISICMYLIMCIHYNGLLSISACEFPYIPHVLPFYKRLPVPDYLCLLWSLYRFLSKQHRQHSFPQEVKLCPMAALLLLPDKGSAVPVLILKAAITSQPPATHKHT